MRSVFRDPRVVDLALVVLIVECMIVVRAVKRRAWLSTADILLQLSAGACLLVALRVALAGADPLWIGLCLAGALPANVYDTIRRLRPGGFGHPRYEDK